MTTNDEPTSVLVVRAWQLPDGPLCARVGTVCAPWRTPGDWQTCVGPEQTLIVVRTWLWSLVPGASAPPGDAAVLGGTDSPQTA